MDASTIASLSTAVGTLVLAVATFSSVRSGQRSARVAERSLLLGLRPMLAPSHLNDPPEKVAFGDRHFVRVQGGMAAIEADGENIYLVMPLRNVGAGLAVLHSWHVRAVPAWDDPQRSDAADEHADPSDFRRLSRDLYVPAGDVGFWQGAIRDADDPLRVAAARALSRREPLFVDVLYGDEEGGQRTVTRFSLAPHGDDGTPWSCGVVRHWRLDGFNPRD